MMWVYEGGVNLKLKFKPITQNKSNGNEQIKPQ